LLPEELIRQAGLRNKPSLFSVCPIQETRRCRIERQKCGRGYRESGPADKDAAVRLLRIRVQPCLLWRPDPDTAFLNSGHGRKPI
jgi:hypothetical protein